MNLLKAKQRSADFESELYQVWLETNLSRYYQNGLNDPLPDI